RQWVAGRGRVQSKRTGRGRRGGLGGGGGGWGGGGGGGGGGGSRSRHVLLQPLPRDGPDVAVLDVRERIEAPHLTVGDLAPQLLERRAQRRVTAQGLVPHDHRRLVRREIPPVVLQADEVQRHDLAVRRIARDHVDLAVGERPIRETEI